MSTQIRKSATEAKKKRLFEVLENTPGIMLRDISERFGLSRTTVKKWKREWETSRA